MASNSIKHYFNHRRDNLRSDKYTLSQQAEGKGSVLWDVMSCNPLKINGYFGRNMPSQSSGSKVNIPEDRPLRSHRCETRKSYFSLERMLHKDSDRKGLVETNSLIVSLKGLGGISPVVK
jgi:hypothetical protein